MERLTDDEYQIADRIELALEGEPAGLTPSKAARKARTTTGTAARVLAWMVRERYAHTSGNGAWTRYHAGRERWS